MFDKLHNDDDRGQVGIGTLIVFIAMVLVAAIAAGVLINTAGFLQSGAEETGQQSSDQVTNRLQEVSSVGIVTNGNISSVNITVKKAPGANNIDLSTTTLQFVHSSGSTDMTYVENASNIDASTEFSVEPIQDEGGESITVDSPVLNDPADRARIVLNTTQIVGNGGLSEGDTATIQLNTQSGGTTEIRLVVPETLSGASAVTL
ncbi:archaellin/type IV pilin N-terminal domain-containing protein [Haloarcula salinisoli]|uniref:Flagellin n=1 Tax=Haloarcula salinisoli TaxID=2487746 RepID=A0A8J7YNI3_9EURY|nr:archaellin/type IV pilin N-terminal domain-containing protein [Halomicroarcula salinisoli]MBX0287115.1 flagellin [Halomicroarcula salinisoli]MBX0304418.1 flagellin [Halomicroarcula salinisoli]